VECEDPVMVYDCFFFQAEDGIRDFHVTGVQTCALPICCRTGPSPRRGWTWPPAPPPSSATSSPRRGSCSSGAGAAGRASPPAARSEERRVGREWRGRWVLYPL